MFPKLTSFQTLIDITHAVSSVLNRLPGDEDGAVTVDWVVLTAAVVSMSVLTYAGLADSNAAVTTATAEALLTARDFLPE